MCPVFCVLYTHVFLFWWNCEAIINQSYVPCRAWGLLPRSAGCWGVYSLMYLALRCLFSCLAIGWWLSSPTRDSTCSIPRHWEHIPLTSSFATCQERNKQKQTWVYLIRSGPHRILSTLKIITHNKYLKRLECLEVNLRSLLDYCLISQFQLDKNTEDRN